MSLSWPSSLVRKGMTDMILTFALERPRRDPMRTWMCEVRRFRRSNP